MNKFYVYPKEGERFDLECGRLKVTDAGVDLRDENGEPSEQTQVAAPATCKCNAEETNPC